MTWFDKRLPDDHIRSAPGAKPEMWAQEAIFGHRLIKDQRPYMLVLETLSVCRARLLDADGLPCGPGPIFVGLEGDGKHEQVHVRVPRQAELRFILFEDREIDRLRQNKEMSNDERLAAWVSHLNEQGRSLLGKEKAFDYIADRFAGRFDDLAQAVHILRGMQIDVGADRAWTRRYLVPRGPHLHLADFKPDWSLDRIFFGRGGELVYLMLNRSGSRPDLEILIRKQFFAKDDPMEALAASISPQGDLTTSDSAIGYLPYATAPAFHRMGEDWRSILRLPRLPLPQKVDPLSRLTAFNLVRYFAEVVDKIRGRVDPLPIDCCNGNVRPLQKLCRNALTQAREAIDDALEIHARSRLEKDEPWAKALSAMTLAHRSELAIEAIEKTFGVKSLTGREKASREPEAWLQYFLKMARERRNNAIEDLFLPLGKQAGFVTDRQKIGAWFCASDEFLEALVLSTVTTPVTIEKFIADLHDRYGIVVGLRQAQIAYSDIPIDGLCFDSNARAFERRLVALDLVKRLSDDCAFVSNPFFQVP